MDFWSVEGLLLVTTIFLFAGFSKGVVGLGLPTISVGLGTAFYGLETALAIAVAPVVVSNIWQGLSGGYFRTLMKRLWPLLLMAGALSWVGTGILARSDAGLIAGVLGIVLIAYGVIGLTTPKFPHPGRHEIWMTPVVGACTGVVTGMTGSAVVPGVLYLQALGFGRDQLVQAMGILFTVSWAALAVGLADNRLLTADIPGVSAVAVVPTFAGMLIGQRIRSRIPEMQFKKVLLVAILLLGIYIVARAGMALL